MLKQNGVMKSLKRKKLIFVDNDDRDQADKDKSFVWQYMKTMGNVPSEYLSTMEIISDLHRMDREAIFDIFFNPDNVVCTWSMYTTTHHGSMYQMLSILNAASISEIKNAIYIDGSGCLPIDLARVLRDGVLVKDKCMAILNAIEQNNIIVFDHDIMKVCRLRIELKGLYESPFRMEEIDLMQLLETK